MKGNHDKHGNAEKHGNGNHDDGSGIDRKLHNPIADRLIPLEPLDLGKVRSIDDLVRAMSKTAFTGRQLGGRRPTCSRPWLATKSASW